MTYQLPETEAREFKQLLKHAKIPFTRSHCRNAGYIGVLTCGFNLDRELILFKKAMKMDGYA